MASITVRVATHLDVSADARGRARTPLRPRAEEFTSPELDVPKVPGDADVEAEAGAPAGDGGEPLAVPEQEWSRDARVRFPLASQELLAVAYYQEVGASSVLKQYRSRFLETLGSYQAPGGLSGRAGFRPQSHFPVMSPQGRRALEAKQA